MAGNAIAKEVVDADFRIHTTLGSGLLESVYRTVLAHVLSLRGLRAVSRQSIRWSMTVSESIPGSEPIWCSRKRSS
jgi:GxxExxY protein